MGRIKNYLVDTDIFIDWYNAMPWAKKIFIDPPGRLYYSKLTRKELLTIPGISNKEKKKIRDLLFRLRIIEVDSEIATKALEITHSYGTKPGDSIIAATAIVKKMMLVTRNLKHFNIIPELQLYEMENRSSG